MELNDRSLAPCPMYLFKDDFLSDIILRFRLCHVHELYPFHLILGLQFLRDLPAAFIPLHERIIPLLTLEVNLMQMIVQCTFQHHPIQPRLMILLQVFQAHPAPTPNRIVGGMVFQIRKIVIAMERVADAIVNYVLFHKATLLQHSVIPAMLTDR